MKRTTVLLARCPRLRDSALGGKCAINQWRGCHLSVSDLFQVVRRVSTEKSRTSDFNYQSVGSGAGIKQTTDGTVDFGASDMPMTDEQMKAYQDKTRIGHSALSHSAWRSGPDV